MSEKNKIKIAIANRGEVAVRIHKACKELGYTTVLLHSKPDVDSKAYRLCDETFCIGEGPAPESYINIENVIKGAKDSGCKALHPGFGFLSENATFASECQKQGLTFIGPSPDSMRLFGDKIKAKDFRESLDVPTLKSYRGEDQSLSTFIKEAKNLGYPVLVKASAGGGGRGMRVVHAESEFTEALDSAKAEALKAFGSDEMFLEQYLERAKHIEVQVFGNSDNSVFVLGERECSVQRRHQKIIEEALSPSLDQSLRDEVYGYAKKLTSSANYKNAGTVEFLFSNNKFYFLEVNTRLQVEHPVTEEVFSVDLVQAQIKTAFNESVSFDSKPNGSHSIECRLYAEDLKGFPSVGRLGTVDLSGKGVRVEQGFERDDVVSPFYDSMIAKTIYTANSRNECIEAAINHLKGVKLTGLMTNIPLLISILEHSDFVSGKMDTGFFADNYADGLTAPLNEDQVKELVSKNIMNSDDKLFSKRWSV